MTRANGVVFWQGSSLIDGAPLVCVMTGLAASSANSKTGGMAQTYILRADMPPIDAIREGADTAICGNCPHRSVASGGAGSCYVNVGQGPRSVYAAWQRGRYPEVAPVEAASLLHQTGRKLRMGAYGDPGAIPAGVWWVLTYPHGKYPHTGYTHRWRDTGAGLRGLCMASVDSAAEAQEAQALGWSTFRVAPKGDPLRMAGEARCPASAEAGKRVTCDGCPMLCDGVLRPGNVGRVIQAHGSTAKRVV